MQGEGEGGSSSATALPDPARVSELETIVANGRAAALRKILKDDPGMALHPGLLPMAAYHREAGVIEMLLDCGADVDDQAAGVHPSGTVQSALDVACCNVDVELVKMLLSRGAATTCAHVQYAEAAAAVRPDNPTWERCASQCAIALNTERCRRARRHWRVAITVVSELLVWHRRAAARVYEPGNAGYEAAAASWRAGTAAADATAVAAVAGSHTNQHDSALHESDDNR